MGSRSYLPSSVLTSVHAPSSLIICSIHVMVAPSHFVAVARIQRTDVFVLCFTAPMRIELQFVKADRCYPFHRTFTSLHLFGGQPAVMGCFRTFNLTPGGCFSSCSPNKVRILRADKSSIHVCLTLKPQATGKRFIYRRTTLGYIHEF